MMRNGKGRRTIGYGHASHFAAVTNFLRGRMDPDMAKIREKAAALIPSILEQRPNQFVELQRKHVADQGTYKFDCRRHGSFLAVFVTRGVAPFPLFGIVQRSQIEAVQAINLQSVATINFHPGRDVAPNGGRASFRREYPDKVAVVWQADNYPRFDKFFMPSPNTPHPLHYGAGYYSPSDEALSNLHVADCPIGALDDVIVFEGLGLQMLVPTGLGRGVYEKILKAMES